MGALIGFVFGYMAGVKAGPQGLEELRQAWQTVAASEEFQGLVAAAMGFAQNLVAESGGAVTSQIQALAAGNGELLEGLGAKGSLGTTWLEISQSREFKELLEGGTQFVGQLLTQGSAMMARSQGHR